MLIMYISTLIVLYHLSLISYELINIKYIVILYVVRDVLEAFKAKAIISIQKNLPHFTGYQKGH